MKIKAWLFRRSEGRCNICGNKLNSTEKYYYINTCERCERKQMKKLAKEYENCDKEIIRTMEKCNLQDKEEKHGYCTGKASLQNDERLHDCCVNCTALTGRNVKLEIDIKTYSQQTLDYLGKRIIEIIQNDCIFGFGDAIVPAKCCEDYCGEDCTENHVEIYSSRLNTQYWPE